MDEYDSKDDVQQLYGKLLMEITSKTAKDVEKLLNSQAHAPIVMKIIRKLIKPQTKQAIYATVLSNKFDWENLVQELTKEPANGKKRRTSWFDNL